MRRLKRVVKSLVEWNLLVKLRSIWFRLRAPFYSGRNVLCPCCGRTFRKFLTAGVRRIRSNARCPRCGSWERQRMLWLFLKQRTNIFSNRARILHVAPEHVLSKEFARMEHLDYVSADLCSPLASVQMDVTRVCFAESSFDLILCCHVMEHVLDDIGAMRELCQALRPNGLAIFQIPIKREHTFEDSSVVSEFDRERVFGQRDHVRICGQDYMSRFEVAGFEVSVVNLARELGNANAQKYGLWAEEQLIICKRRVAQECVIPFPSNAHLAIAE